jgi:hydrogenase nickel incorporation protein HypA/HybF
MHEASLAQSILDIAMEHCSREGHRSITSVEVRIGSASGVLPEALTMAFDIIKLETMAAQAKLLIDHVPLGGSCRGCGERFVTDEHFILSCPHCGSGDFFLDAGRELDITEIEVEE